MPGRSQVVFAVALFAGLGAAAALLGFDERAVPAGSGTVVDVALLGILAVGGGGVITTSVFRLIDGTRDARSEEHTSELQSLMRISYAVFCLKKKKNIHITSTPHITYTDSHKIITTANI